MEIARELEEIVPDGDDRRQAEALEIAMNLAGGLGIEIALEVHHHVLRGAVVVESE
jgi:hypothetical protein